MSKKRVFRSILWLLPVLGMIVTSCNKNSNNPSEPDYSDVEDEEPIPEPIIISDQGKDDTIFYSDDYFKHKATRYNSHLATLSIYMAKYSQNPGNPDNPDDKDWYEHQSDRVANFWTTIGFSEPRFNEDYYTKTSFDTIGIGAAYRKIKEGNNEFTVIASTVRSGGYFYEWENNVWLGDGSKSDYNHEGWYNAANRVIKFIGDYIAALQKEGLLETKQIKLWLSGFSRGGAVMNITGGLLDNKLGMDDRETRNKIFEGVSLKREDLLVYTFEAPQGANFNSQNNAAKPHDELYYNIFNIVNPNDLVTKVAMQRYGFTRFGIDKFITTEFFDPKVFEFNRQYLKALAHDYDSDYSLTADDFTTYGIDYSDILTDPNKIALLLYWAVSDGDFPEFISEDNTKRNYDANIVIDMLIDRAIDNLGSRDSYCRNFQTFARNLMHYMMPDCKDESTLTWKSLVIMVAVQALGYVVLGPAAGLITDLSLEEITGCTSAEVGFALSIVGDVFIQYPTEVISLAKCISDVFHNHDTQLNIFHAQAQDSYYIKYHNKNQINPIRLVKYRTNSEYVRFECKDINEAHIWVNGDKVIYVNEEDSQANAEHELSFTDFSSTKIYTCDKGYAVGTYSYATEHGMEVFVPSFYDFKYHFYDHSWKPWHLVRIIRWTYNTNENDNRTGRTIVDEYFNCDSDVFEGNYEKDSDYETDLLADLTDTEWKFNITDITRHARIDVDVKFVSDDRSFSHIKGVVSGDNNDYFELYYDDIKAGEGNDYDKTMTWTDIDYCVIRFLGGDGSSDVDLIIWLYREAYQTNYQP